MFSVLRAFYSGNLGYPWQRKAPPENEELKKLVAKIDEIENYLVGHMSAEDGEKYIELRTLHSELNTLNENGSSRRMISMDII